MKLILMLLFSLGLGLAQSHTPSPYQTYGCIGPECPNNVYPNDPQGFNWQPGDVVITGFCVYVYDAHGNPQPVPGVVGNISTYTTQLSGDHSHEITVNTNRPQATIPHTFNPVLFAPPTTAVSGTNGCANWVTVFPDFAGYVTFEVSYNLFPYEIEPGVLVPLQFATQGINNYVGFYNENEFGDFEALEAYPDNPAVNAPQSLNVDQNHNNGSRWFQPSVVAALQAASQSYLTHSGQDAGVIDRANIYRGSLEYGGAADNYLFNSPTIGFLPGFPPWLETSKELHL